MNPIPAILLVDDDEDYLFVARRAIEREGLKADVRIARAGAEALALLGLGPCVPAPAAAGDGSSPDTASRTAVVLLDLSMPGPDGLEVLERIQACDRTRHIPVVVVSSSSRPDDVRRSYELGANSYVVKRYLGETPGAYVAETARYWIELNEPPGSPAGRDARKAS